MLWRTHLARTMQRKTVAEAGNGSTQSSNANKNQRPAGLRVVAIFFRDLQQCAVSILKLPKPSLKLLNGDSHGCFDVLLLHHHEPFLSRCNASFTPLRWVAREFLASGLPATAVGLRVVIDTYFLVATD